MNDFYHVIIQNFPLKEAAELIGGSGVLSGAMIGVIKLFNAQKAWVKLLTVYIGALLAMAVRYKLTHQTDNPLLLTVQSAIPAFFASFWWSGVFKPLIKKTAENKALQAEIKSALEPVANLEAEMTPVVEAVPITHVANPEIHTFDH